MITPMRFEEDLRRIISDSRSGSTAIAGQVVEFFAYHSDAPLVKVRAAAAKLNANFSGMGLVRNCVEEMLHALETGGRVQEKGQELLSAVREQVDASIRKASGLFSGKVKIATISYSSQVAETIMAYREMIDRVYILESRPMSEGITFCNELSEKGIGTTMVTDAGMGTAAVKSDMALIGCDSLLGDGTVIHKTGTLPLALSMRHYGKPVYSVGIPLKREPEFGIEDYPEFTNHDCSEISRDVSNCENYYFEKVPASLLTGVITG